jgi:hypothetical protein
MVELIAKCWQPEPANRPSFEEWIFRFFEKHEFVIVTEANAAPT